jgi:hypothetical protein
MEIILILSEIISWIDINSTFVLAIVALFAVFFPGILAKVNKPKLEISSAKIDPKSAEVEIRNRGRTPAVNCYVRISLEKEDEDVIGSAGEAYITSVNSSARIHEDYVAFSITKNPVRLSIPPRLADRALIANPGTKTIPGGKQVMNVLKVASEMAYNPPRTFLNAEGDKTYGGEIIYGADNCKPKRKKIKLFVREDNKNLRAELVLYK